MEQREQAQCSRASMPRRRATARQRVLTDWLPQQASAVWGCVTRHVEMVVAASQTILLLHTQRTHNSKTCSITEHHQWYADLTAGVHPHALARALCCQMQHYQAQAPRWSMTTAAWTWTHLPPRGPMATQTRVPQCAHDAECVVDRGETKCHHNPAEAKGARTRTAGDLGQELQVFDRCLARCQCSNHLCRHAHHVIAAGQQLRDGACDGACAT